MSLSTFIARRYLFSKKSHNAINIISGIAVTGIAIATIALVCVMSVFNGFRDLLSSLYTTFDPPLVVVPVEGKTIAADDPRLMKMRQHPAVAHASATFDENALILFRGHPLVVRIKGVDDQYDKVTGIRRILKSDEKNPQFLLSAAEINYGIMGQGLAYQIGTPNYGRLQICAPKSGERINVANPIESFNVDDLHSNGLTFAVENARYDNNYILTSLQFATQLFEKEGQLTRLEIALRPGADLDRTKAELRAIAGGHFQVLDQMEQQADVYNVLQLEKLIAYIFLTFIILIACFNIISSLSMLIIEKREDVETLRHLGLTQSRIRAIFMTEGRLIALFGATAGLVLGIALVWLQQEFGFITMGRGDGFLVKAYPVALHCLDLVVIFFTVIAVGFLSVWYPVHAMSRRLLAH